METSIREARFADTGRIAEIHLDASRAAFRGILPDSELDGLSVREMTRRWAPLTFAHDGGLLVAERDKVVGFCSVTPARNIRFDYHTAEIMALYVDPPEQSKGVGTRLLNAALEHAFLRGYTDAMLWVLPQNTSARRLYEWFGFSTDGVEHTDHGLRTGAAHLRYSCDLQLTASSAESAAEGKQQTG